MNGNVARSFRLIESCMLVACREELCMPTVRTGSCARPLDLLLGDIVYARCAAGRAGRAGAQHAAAGALLDRAGGRCRSGGGCGRQHSARAARVAYKHCQTVACHCILLSSRSQYVTG